jgi:hypothetical protein
MRERENELVLCKDELQECRAQLNEQKALADGYKNALEQVSQEC